MSHDALQRARAELTDARIDHDASNAALSRAKVAYAEAKRMVEAASVVDTFRQMQLDEAERALAESEETREETQERLNRAESVVAALVRDGPAASAAGGTVRPERDQRPPRRLWPLLRRAGARQHEF